MAPYVSSRLPTQSLVAELTRFSAIPGERGSEICEGPCCDPSTGWNVDCDLRVHVIVFCEKKPREESG
jgi:hypothetical protein